VPQFRAGSLFGRLEIYGFLIAQRCGTARRMHLMDPEATHTHTHVDATINFAQHTKKNVINLIAKKKSRSLFREEDARTRERAKKSIYFFIISPVLAALNEKL
jgi:hypothetical protein